MSAVSPIEGSIAAQTSGSDRNCVGSTSLGRSVLDDHVEKLGLAGALGLIACPDQLSVRVLETGRVRIIPGDPVEDAVVKLGLRPDVREPEQVPMAPAVPLLVLQGLKRKLAGALAVIPARDRLTEQLAPAAEIVDRVGEVEQVSPNPADARQRLRSGTLRVLVAERHTERESEHGRVVFRRPARVADLDDLVDCSRAVLPDAGDDGLRVLARQFALGRVVSIALAAQNQEPAQACPVVHGVGEPARAVGHLVFARNRRRLRSLLR